MRSSYFHRWIRKDSKNNVRYEEQQYRGETTKATDRLDMARKENTHILIFSVTHIHKVSPCHTHSLSGTLIYASQRTQQMTGEKDRSSVEGKERQCFALVAHNLLFLWYKRPSSIHTELRVCGCVCINILDRLAYYNFLIPFLWLSLHNLNMETSLFRLLSS